MDRILIVGAGPVGLTMALELARYGIGVRLIDRSPTPAATSRALVVWARTLELLERSGETADFLAAGLKARGGTLRSGTRILGGPRFTDIPGRYAFALMIPQSETERLLTERLGGCGGTVERGVELIGFHEEPDRIRARLRHADGAVEEMETPYLLGCDGAHSAVRHGLGAAFPGEAQGDDWVLADVRLTGGRAPPPDELAIWLHRDGPFVVFPLPDGRARLVATVGRSDPAQAPPQPTLAQMQALIDARAGGGFRALDPVWLSGFRINERKVAAYRTGRAFLAGDAAHVHSPAGGQGMNTGMQDAFNLAWKLALVLRGEAAETLLDSYSPERGAVGALVLRNATRLTALATLSNPLAQAARNLALRLALAVPTVGRTMARMLSEIDIAYPAGALSAGREGGTRLVPEDYAGAPPGAGAVPRFVLHAADEAQGRTLAGRYPSLLEPAPRRPPAGGLLIVRPDGYVGFSGAADAWPQAGTWLAALRPGAG